MTAPPAGMRDIRRPVLEQIVTWYETEPGTPHGPAEWLTAIPAAKTWTPLEMLTAMSFVSSVLITMAKAVSAVNEHEGIRLDPVAHLRGWLTLLEAQEQEDDSAS